MIEDQDQGTADADKRTEAKEDGRTERRRRGVNLVITSPARIFLDDLDKSRRLVEIAEEDKEKGRSSLTRRPASKLKVSDRVAIELQVTTLAKSRSRRFSAKMSESSGPDDTKSPNQENSAESASIYPIAFEQRFSVAAMYAEEVEKSIWDDIRQLYESDENKFAFAAAYYTSLSRPDLTEILATSLLSSAIHAFEAYLGALVRTALTVAGPNSLGDLPNLPFDIYQRYGKNVQSNDVERWAIDRRVEDFVRGGYPEWRETFHRWSGFDLDSNGGDWKVIREAIARKKTYERGTGGRIDPEYLKSIDDSQAEGLHPWGDLRTSPKYFRSLADELELASICTGLRWTQHFFPHPNADISLHLERGVELERRGLWRSAMTVFDALLDTFVHSDHESYGITKINQWLCRQELGLEDDATRRAIDSFKPSNAYIRIGHSALRREWTELVDAVKEYNSQTGGGTDLYWMNRMPLLARAMRENPSLKIALGVAPSLGTTGGRRSRKRRRR
ncbi:hypothetical protein [Micromonospora sp. SL4-19]|uniref:hypothetical protein n=1 Tax=Micromonospora sp. SL4-19 TaxID=3399129 RepID=UPI003A4DCAE8